MVETDHRLLLLCLAGTVLCAIPLGHVVEILRPPPIEPLPGAPSAVAGVAIVRGELLPVVVVGRLLEGQEQQPRRLVAVRTGVRWVGLAFDSVLGVRSVPRQVLSRLPPLLDRGLPTVADIATLDGALMLVLDTARVVPDEFFDVIAKPVAAL